MYSVLGLVLKAVIYREPQLIRGNERSKNNFDDNYNLVYSAHNYYISIFQLTYYTNVTDERRT